MLDRIAPAGGPTASGAYSPAIRAGNLIFVSGQGPFDPSSVTDPLDKLAQA